MTLFTCDMLKNMGACEAGRLWFEAAFPDGVTLPKPQDWWRDLRDLDFLVAEWVYWVYLRIVPPGEDHGCNCEVCNRTLSMSVLPEWDGTYFYLDDGTKTSLL